MVGFFMWPEGGKKKEKKERASFSQNMA